jgi:cardiolipin synthase C
MFINNLTLLMLVISGVACSTKLEIREDIPDSAFACMQHYSPGSDPMVRTTGKHAPTSSFLPLNDGRSALEWRLALIDSASHSLKIQYFLWKTDEIGSLIVRRVLAAANRGVVVRILMDDFDSPNWNQRAAVLTLHPNIEIRVFNPFKKKRGKWASRGFELVTDLDRLNHRMHNKLIVADNRVAIVGGRNLGNEYFGVGKTRDLRDYDILAIGPVVAELNDSFDLFWDGIWSYRLSDLPAGEGNVDEIEALRSELDQAVLGSDWLSREFDIAPRNWSAHIAMAKANLTTAPSRAVFDCPPPEGEQFPVQTALTLNEIAKRARDEIILISPYLVPLEGFHRAVQETTARGVTVRILTNSLAAADHTIAFSGYKKHRVQLLENGATLHELRPDADIWPQHRLPPSTAKHITLHAKVALIDRRWVYVGSLNLDPRAVHWNTELGVLIDSKEISAQIYADFSDDLKPENSWQVELQVPDTDTTGGQARPNLVWVAGDEKKTREPSRGMIQRINLWFFSLLSIDEQL